MQIYKDLKKKNNNIVVTVAPENFVDNKYSIFPLSGVSNAETIYCNENGYYSIYRSDRFGFNNPDSEWEAKEIEYLLVGDSFVHGACVNRPYDITSILRNLSNKSSLNLGYASNGPLIEYATLKEYLGKNVKKVLWIYFEGNDLGNLLFELNYKQLTDYINISNHTQNLNHKQKDINKILIDTIKTQAKEQIDKSKKKQNFNFEITNFMKIYNTRNLLLSNNLPKIPLPFADFKKILRKTKDLTNKNNSKLYFIYLPEYQRYNSNYNNNNYDLVKNIVSDINIPFIDIHKEVFEKEKNPLSLFPFELNGHYNEYGYNKIAKTIFQLTKN